MKDETHPAAALQVAVLVLLRPLIRLLLRHSMPFATFEGLAKRAYVDVAMKEFAIPGKKPSISRAAILTGLTRKDVQRLATADHSLADVPEEQYNRASRVLTGWIRDPDFLNGRGKPRTLALDGDDGFAALVRRHSGDVPWRAVLDELLRVGAVVQRTDGRLAPVTRAYVPQRGEAEMLQILGNDVAGLVDTIDHNLQHGATDPRFQRKVSYRSIATKHLPAFRKLSAARAQAVLEELDRWLAERDDVSPDDTDIPHAQVGLGIYYMEQRANGS
jgi:hypothetical protein